MVSPVTSGGTSAGQPRTPGGISGGTSAAPGDREDQAIRGFTGSDPSPTLTQVKAWVAVGEIRYYVLSSAGGGARGRDSSTSYASAIASWVAQHYTAKTVGSATVYDLQVG
ncbi:MAG: hypothetical protein QOF53_669 [Nocardioidaceae bacterium]|jgi:hypothetical protein|nr:hypothetical protein [Nocardioidaceae bacterium]